jgi:hypothetical protein
MADGEISPSAYICKSLNPKLNRQQIRAELARVDAQIAALEAATRAYDPAEDWQPVGAVIVRVACKSLRRYRRQLANLALRA